MKLLGRFKKDSKDRKPRGDADLTGESYMSSPSKKGRKERGDPALKKHTRFFG